MHYARYPFIDLAVHPAIRERFAAGDALVVATPDLDTILWANGAAARLFGFASIYEFLEDGIGAGSAARRQIESALTGIAQAGARDFLFRSSAGFRRTAVNARVELMALPDGAPAVLISAHGAGAHGEAARARQVISGFDGTDTHVAVLDARGSVLAASPSFARIGLPASECARLVADVAGEADRLVKRMVASAGGLIPAAIGRLTDDPALHLIFAVDPATAEEPIEDEPAAPEADEPATKTEFDALREALAATLPAETPADATPGFATSDVVIADDAAASRDAGDDALWASVPPQNLHPDMASREDADEDELAAGEDVYGPGDDADDAEDEAELEALDGAEPEEAGTPDPASATAGETVPAGADFTFDPQAHPARFVWKIDREGAFSEVSPEFAATLGPNAADIIGRKFGDIAQVFNLDPDHVIADLLSRRDTWSGKTVYWPAQGTDLVVPVDLAALPTYTRDRQFDGFRGFGIVRVSDARKDPEALGLALVPGRPLETRTETGFEAEAPETTPEPEAPTSGAEVADVVETAGDPGLAADDAPMDGADSIEMAPEAADETPAVTEAPTGESGGDASPAEDDPDADPFRGERPALHIVANPGRRESDKIIDLGERRARTREGLSPLEQAAFREIGARLTASAANAAETEARRPANDTPAARLTDKSAPEASDDGDARSDEATATATDRGDETFDTAGIETFDEVEIVDEASLPHAAATGSEAEDAVSAAVGERDRTGSGDVADAAAEDAAEAGAPVTDVVSSDERDDDLAAYGQAEDEASETADDGVFADHAEDARGADRAAADEVVADDAQTSTAAVENRAPEAIDSADATVAGEDAAAEDIAASGEPSADGDAGSRAIVDDQAPEADGSADVTMADDDAAADVAASGELAADGDVAPRATMEDQASEAGSDNGTVADEDAPAPHLIAADEAAVDGQIDPETKASAEDEADIARSDEAPAGATDADMAKAVGATDADDGEAAGASDTAELKAAGISDADEHEASGKSERAIPTAMPSAFALPARQALTEELVDAIPAPLLVHAGDRLIHANRDFLSLTGYASLDDLAAAGGLDRLLDRPGDGEEAGTITMRRADDEEVPVAARLRSINWREGQALLLALTPAPRAEAPAAETGRPAAMDEATVRRLGALEVEAAELRSILETATDGVVTLGVDGAIRSMNGSACALFGYDEAETRGKPFAMLFAHESQRAVIDYFSGLAEHGVSSVLNDGREVIGREANGGFLPLFMTMGRLSGSNGFCAVLRDITQWKRSEEELRNAKRAAETASSHKSEFLARVSHEIRTPLNAIIGFSEMMVEERFGPIGSPRYLEYAHDIGNSGKHVLDIVNDLLDISKIEAGEVELEFAAVSLNDQLAECVSMLQPMANGQRVIIRTSLSASVPDVVADLRSIKQIALNLLSNAIRYTPSGGQIVVSTSYEPTGNVVLKIRDTGIGMTRKELEQAMKPFGQVGPGPRQRGDGTGLGLPLTKAMVEANRAQFDIVSAPSEGTLVTIVFPPQRVLAD